MKLIPLFCLLTLPLFALAQEATPDCWTTDGSDIGKNSQGLELADGHFLIPMDTSIATKEDLIEMMKGVKFGNLMPGTYPNIFDDLIIFHAIAVKNDAEREALKAAVNEQIKNLTAIPGVAGASCNSISRPAR